MSSSLPNKQENSSAIRELETSRSQYKYNYTYIPNVAMVDKLPAGENFSIDWFIKLAEALKDIFINTLITNRGHRGSKKVDRDIIRCFIFEVIRKGAIPFNLTG